MELFAAGFNAWNQLQFDITDGEPEPDDVRVFTRVLTDEAIDHVQPFLSYTRVISRPSGIRSAGMIPRGHEALRTTGDGITTAAPKINDSNYFAQASNGVIVVYDKITKTLNQYPSIDNLLHQQPDPTWPHTFPHDITQLVSYETGFAALSSTGQVFTWGDERYAACLGRDVDDTNPATTPNPLPSLESLPTGTITKIAAGGTVLAALTSGNDLYIWGQQPRTPPGSSRPPLLDTLDLSGDPAPADVDDWKDIADVAIGDGHLLALTTEGGLFVIGDNSNGQLGLPDIAESTNVWTRVDIDGVGPGKSRVKSVVAGPRNSFVLVQTD